MVEIVEVKTRKQLKDFILFPFKIFQDNPYWVPPLIRDEFNTLDKKKNPAFEYCEAKYWLAYKEGELVGRIAGIQNHSYVKKWGNKYTRFGWVDFVDDPEVSKALFDTVEEYARENGMNAVHGPLGFCDLDHQGLLIDGFEEMGTIVTNYHHPYYRKHLEQLGYEKDVDWLEYEILVPEKDEIEKLNKIAERALEKYDLHMVKLDHNKQALPYAKQVFDIINIAYEELYGVVPLTEKQVKVYVDQYFSFINPDYICFIVDKDDNLVGFGISVPSLSKAVKKHNGRILPFGFIDVIKAIKDNDTLDLLLVAVKPEYKLTGIPAAMLSHSLKNAHKNGIKKAIASPMLENNYAVQSLWRFFDTRPHRRRRCFIKRFDGII